MADPRDHGVTLHRPPWLGWLASLPALFWLISTCLELWGLAQGAAQLPRWDMAKYGAAASRLQHAIEGFHPWALLSEIHQLSSWPFVLPLVESWAFIGFGNHFSTARCLMVVFFGLTCGLALVLAWGLARNGTEGLILSLWTALLVIGSPLLHLYGVLNMLEMPGALCTLLAMAVYLRLLKEPWKPSSWWWLAAVSALLFFLKYNYGLIWLLSLGLAECRRRAGSWHRALAKGWEWVRYRAFGPWRFFVVAVLTVLVALRLTSALLGSGGGLSLGPLKLPSTSIGNPLYVLLLLTVGHHLLLARHRRLWMHRWRGKSMPDRRLALALGLPILLWMLLPPHCKDFFGFVENRSSGLPWWSGESLGFYVRVMAQDYLRWPSLTWPLLFLAAWKAWRLPTSTPAWRLVTLFVLINGAALMAHPYKLARFALTLWVPLVLLAGGGLLDLLHLMRRGLNATSLRRRLGDRAWRFGGAQWWLAPCLLLVAWGFRWLPAPTDEDALARRFEAQGVDPQTLPLLDHMLHLATVAPGETAILGTWNLFSPSLIEWRQAQVPGFEEAQPLMGRPLARRLRRRSWPSQALGLELLGDRWRPDLAQAHLLESGAWRNEWEALSANRAFELEAVEIWPTAGYRLHRWRQGTGAAPRINESP